MKFTFYHNNINVLNLEKSVDFYKNALGLTVTREKKAEDGSFRLVFMGDNTTPHLLELTWLRDMVRVDDFDKALAHHKEMNCVCFENTEMGIYFIEDPDGYWIEICPCGE